MEKHDSKTEELHEVPTPEGAIEEAAHTTDPAAEHHGVPVHTHVHAGKAGWVWSVEGGH